MVEAATSPQEHFRLRHHLLSTMPPGIRAALEPEREEHDFVFLRGELLPSGVMWSVTGHYLPGDGGNPANITFAYVTVNEGPEVRWEILSAHMLPVDAFVRIQTRCQAAEGE